jgi:hypothetical protein
MLSEALVPVKLFRSVTTDIRLRALGDRSHCRTAAQDEGGYLCQRKRRRRLQKEMAKSALMEAVHVRNVPQSVVPRDKSAVTAAPVTTPTRSAVMLTIHFFQNAICAGRPTEVRRHSEDSIPRLNNGERQYAEIRRPAPRPALGPRWAPALAAVSRSSRPRLGSRLRMHSPRYWSR